MAENNSTIITKAYLDATNDFQQRISNPTQHGIAQFVEDIFDPMNGQYYNQFIDILVNRFGEAYVHNLYWKNVLSVFKKSKMEYGFTAVEMVPHWIRAHSYVDDAEDVFKMHRPDVSTWYHSQNRRDYYPITINRDELRSAFDSENGLNKLIASIMQVPYNSDEYDEYQIMKNLIAAYYDKWGFFSVNAPMPTDEQSAKNLLKLFKTYGRKITFPSALYNSGKLQDVPVFAQQGEQILIVTPEVEASIDVDALAVLFHLEPAQVRQRIVVIDEFPIPKANALLTTEDFFFCKDTEYTTTSIYNPKTLGMNYYLHHWGIYSVSPFVPAILFTDDADTEVNKITMTINGITATPSVDTAKAGDKVQISVTASGTVTAAIAGSDASSIKVLPDSCTYDVSIVDDDGTGVTDSRTFVDEYGRLHIGENRNDGDVITVDVKSTYVNPSGETPANLTGSVTVTVDNDIS